MVSYFFIFAIINRKKIYFLTVTFPSCGYNIVITIDINNKNLWSSITNFKKIFQIRNAQLIKY